MKRTFFHNSKKITLVGLLATLALLGLVYAAIPRPSLDIDTSANQDRKITFNAPIVIEFSQPMHKGSVESAFAIYPRLAGAIQWTDAKSMEFRPENDFQIGESVRIEIGREARSIWGKPLAGDYALNYIATGPPKVIFVIPEANAQPQAETEEQAPAHLTEDAITVMFDRPMDFSAAKKNQLIQINPPVSGETSFIGKSAFFFEPYHMDPNQVYTVTVPAGIPAQAGGKTQEALTWKVQAPPLKVVTISPRNHSEGVPLEAPILVTFSESVPLDGIKPGKNIRLYPSNDLDAANLQKEDGFFNTEVSHFIDRNQKKHTDQLIFAPTFPYQPETEYRFVIEADKNLPLRENQEFYFKTASTREAADDSGKNSEMADEKGPASPHLEYLKFIAAGEPATLELPAGMSGELNASLCSMNTTQFIDVNKVSGWKGYRCTNPETVSFEVEEYGPEIQLNQIFADPLESGFYFFRAADDAGDQFYRIIVVQDLALLLKKSDEELLVWTNDLKSGEPASRMEIRILDYEGREQARGVTDGNGVYQIRETFEEGVYVIAESRIGESKWAFLHQFWQGGKHMPESTSYLPVYVILNQSRFTAGAELAFKGYWREKKGHLLSLPDTRQVTVRITGDSGDLVYEETIPLRKNGSFDGQVQLDDAFQPGHYRLTMTDSDSFLLSEPVLFQVLAATPEIELNWSGHPDAYAKGTVPVIGLHGHYASGLPAANKKVYYSLYRMPAEPAYIDDSGYAYTLSSQAPPGNMNRERLWEGETRLDADGRQTLTLSPEDSFLESGYIYELEAYLDAKKNGLNPARTAFRVQNGEYEVGAGLRHHLIAPGDPLEVHLVALDTDTVRLPDKRISLRLQKAGEKGETLAEKTVQTEAAPVFAEMPVPSGAGAGSYRLVASASDTSGNAIQVRLPVYLTRDQTRPVSSNLKLLPDQPLYYVKGRAHFMVNYPEASAENPVPALLTYERDGLIGSEALLLNSPLTPVSFTIRETMMPNIYVTLTVFDEGVFKKTQETLRVKNDEQMIYIDAAMDPPDPGPGDTVTLDLKTYDYQKRPLPSVLSLNLSHGFGGQTASPADYYYRPGPLVLEEASNLMPVIPAVAKSPLIEAFFTTFPKQSLVFRPVIAADSGRATAELTLPKDFKGGRITLFASSQAYQFGKAVIDFNFNNRLEIHPVLPERIRPHDRFKLRADIRNISNEAVNNTVELISKELYITGSSKRNLSLRPDQSMRVEWLVEVKEADAVKVMIRSREDSLVKKIPVQKGFRSSLLYSSGPATDSAEVPLMANIQDPERFRQAELILGNSASVLNEAYRTLFNTGLPVTLEARAEQVIIHLQDEAADTAEGLRSAVNELVSHQLPEGGFPFWPGGTDFDPITSSTMLRALKQAAEQGAELSPAVIETTAAALWRFLSENSDTVSPRNHAYILWCLSAAGSMDTGYTIDFVKSHPDLALEGRSFLLLTLQNLFEAGQRSISPFIEEELASVTDEVIENGNDASFRSPGRTPEYNYYLTALGLYTLIQVSPQHPSIPSLGQHLLSAAGAADSDTNHLTLFWAIMAFDQLLQSQPPLPANYLIKASHLGKTVLDFSVAGQEESEYHKAVLDMNTDSTVDPDPLKITKDGVGLYYAAVLSKSARPRLPESIEEGLILAREFRDHKGRAANRFEKGQMAREELTLVVPRPLSSVVLKVPVVPGLVPEGYQSDSDWQLSTSGTDMPLYFSAADLSPGVYRIRLNWRAVLPGSFHLPPAGAHAFYNPGIHARSGGETIIIKEE